MRVMYLPTPEELHVVRWDPKDKQSSTDALDATILLRYRKAITGWQFRDALEVFGLADSMRVLDKVIKDIREVCKPGAVDREGGAA